MSNDVVGKQVGEADARAEDNKPGEQRRDERLGTVRVGKVKEETQGQTGRNLDGYYGPGWTKYW